MKKFFLNVLVVMLVLAMSIGAALADCNHNGTIVRIGKITDIYRQYTTTKHEYGNLDRHQCTACGQYFQLEAWIGYASHSFRYTGDVGHISGTSSHRARGTCTKCSFNGTYTYSCSGNPCIYPQ